MVATSLPFWMHQPSRVMSPFLDQTQLRPDPSDAGRGRPGPGAVSQRPMAPGILVEVCDVDSILAHEGAWTALATHALEPNVFLEPGFALPAIRHFRANQWPTFLLVWATEGEGRASLIGLCALRPLLAARGPAVSSAWRHEQATLSAPLLDADRAGEALDVMLDWLARRSTKWSGLVLSGVPLDGPLMAILGGRGRQVVELDRRSRAVLRRTATPSAPAAGRRAKEMRRQRRRLAERGVCTFRSARAPDEVRAATERFLDLEARGWKGGRGTALLNDAGLAAFTRAMTRRLAHAGLCRIDTLDIDGVPAAMGIVLRSGDRAFYWKTCYDEKLHRFSPGKLLAAMIGDVQRDDPALALTDSCAVPNHAMIDHLWPDRMTVVDLIVAGASVDPARLARAARLIGLWRRCRGGAKTLRNLLRQALARLRGA